MKKSSVTFLIAVCSIAANGVFILHNFSRLTAIRAQRKELRGRLSAQAGGVPSAGQNPSAAAVKTAVLPVPEAQIPSEPLVKVQKDAGLKKPDLRLLGIMHADKSFAFVETSPREGGVFSEGDYVGGYKLVKILQKSIVLRDGEKTHVLHFAPAEKERISLPVQINSPHERVIPRESLNRSILRIAQEANAVKISAAVDENNEVRGLRLSEIPPVSVIKDIGLNNDDIVSSINGIKTDSIGAALAALRQLRGEKEFQIEIIRSNAALTLKYEIK